MVFVGLYLGGRLCWLRLFGGVVSDGGKRIMTIELPGKDVLSYPRLRERSVLRWRWREVFCDCGLYGGGDFGS